MAETEITAIASSIHKKLFDDIEFSKRQQWAVTNYVLLVYAAMFCLNGHFQAHATCLNIILSVLAFVAGGYAAFLLVKMQLDMARYRRKLVSAHAAWLNERIMAATQLCAV
jgi:hypothetical protein